MAVPIFVAIGDFVFVFFGSIILGYIIGIFAGVCSKCIDFKHSQQRMSELAAYILLQYLPYFSATSIELSGIVATLFGGISVRHYAEPNLSKETKREVRHFYDFQIVDA